MIILHSHNSLSFITEGTGTEVKEVERLIKLSQKGGGQLHLLNVSHSNSERNIHEGSSSGTRSVMQSTYITGRLLYLFLKALSWRSHALSAFWKLRSWVRQFFFRGLGVEVRVGINYNDGKNKTVGKGSRFSRTWVGHGPPVRASNPGAVCMLNVPSFYLCCTGLMSGGSETS